MKKNLFFAAMAIGLLLIGGPSYAQKSKTMSNKEIEKTILGYMDECKTAGMSVVLMKGDKAVYQHAFGYRDFESKEPLEINDIFRIASISKSFSGVSIMQLVEAGKMSLEDDVNQYLGFSLRNPKYPDIPITVKMLLSHTSSMIDKHGASWYRDDKYVNPAKMSADTIAMCFGDWAPGQGYQYCNRALNLIGLIIEKVSGERFDNYVLNHILRPIGADNAGYNLDSLDKKTFVTLYTYDAKKDTIQRALGYVPINEFKLADGTYKIGKDGCYWSPTGGMKISAPNLAKWMKTLQRGGVALNGNRVLSEAGMKKLLTPVTPADPDVYYCLTTRTEPHFIKGKVLKGHTGSAQGLKSCMFFDPESDWGFVVLCSSTKLDQINSVYKIYYNTINLLYEQYRDVLEK
jgi:CubicO group peptidase (beta-lactamase class C family)